MKKIIAAILTVGMMLCLCAGALAAGSALTLEAAVEQFLQKVMAEQASSASNGWQRYVYSRGVSNITMSLENYDKNPGKPLAVSFMLTSGNPHIKEQPKYAGDAEAYLNGIVQSMSTPDTKLKLNLSITGVSGGYAVTFAPKADAALQKAVSSAAASAQKAFADKRC